MSQPTAFVPQLSERDIAEWRDLGGWGSQCFPQLVLPGPTRSHKLSSSPPAVLHSEARLNLMDESTPSFPSPFQGCRDALEQTSLHQNPLHLLFSVPAWLRRGPGPRVGPRVGLGLQEPLDSVTAVLPQPPHGHAGAEGAAPPAGSCWVFCMLCLCTAGPHPAEFPGRTQRRAIELILIFVVLPWVFCPPALHCDEFLLYAWFSHQHPPRTLLHGVSSALGGPVWGPGLHSRGCAVLCPELLEGRAEIQLLVLQEGDGSGTLLFWGESSVPGNTMRERGAPGRAEPLQIGNRV